MNCSTLTAWRQGRQRVGEAANAPAKIRFAEVPVPAAGHRLDVLTCPAATRILVAQPVDMRTQLNGL